MAEVCPSCGEVFWKKNDVRKMEERAKRIGVWELEQKTKVATVGNSLAVRIPKRLANFLRLKEGVEVVIHPIGKDKLVIEGASKHG
jgi:putative transposon-encoded protein